MNRLIKHKGYKHPAEAPVYSCEQCGKCFTAKRKRLKGHVVSKVPDTVQSREENIEICWGFFYLEEVIGKALLNFRFIDFFCC